jgi:hypothetical protein
MGTEPHFPLPFCFLHINQFSGSQFILLATCLLAGLAEIISSTLKMEAICSSETSVASQQTTRRHIPEDDTLHNNRCENLKSYMFHSFTLRTMLRCFNVQIRSGGILLYINLSSNFETKKLQNVIPI